MQPAAKKQVKKNNIWIFPSGLCWKHDVTESQSNIQNVEVTKETSANALKVILTVWQYRYRGLKTFTAWPHDPSWNDLAINLNTKGLEEHFSRLSLNAGKVVNTLSFCKKECPWYPRPDPNYTQANQVIAQVSGHCVRMPIHQLRSQICMDWDQRPQVQT